MVCIYCKHSTKVVNSRPNVRTGQIWRRRMCPHCKRVWSTYEAADYSQLLIVKYPDGRLQPYNRDRLFASILGSCQHRAKAVEDAAALTDTILRVLFHSQTDGSLTTEKIISQVMIVLNRFDTSAAVHYKAFHGTN